MMNRTILDNLPAGVSAPGYDPSAIGTGIVHFGVGNFFRAHEAFYVDRCLALPGQQGWGIVGVGLTDGARSAAKADSFRAQDCLYSLTEAAPDGSRTVRVIGALRDYLLAPADPAAVLDRLSDPATRIVTMTITEGGYNIDETNGTFRLDTPAVRADLDGDGLPTTIFGFVVEALARRRAAGAGPFTIVSCDNLRHNGDVARTAFLGYAQARDPALAAWMAENVTFPNGMVDRITPTVDQTIAAGLNAASGLDDALPLVAEDFTQWVLEDKFCAGRPALEQVGVEFVDDVTGYEQVKVRMLNASHIMLAFSGILLGYRLVHDTLTDPDLARFVNAYLEQDVIPRLTAPAGLDPEAYRRSVLSRFSNPAMADQLLRIGGDGSSKVQVYWTETVRRALAADGDLSRIAFGIAAYLEMLRGVDEAGDSYTPFEPTLNAAHIALVRDDDLAAALALPAFDGWRDVQTPELTNAIVTARRAIRDKGVRAALPK
ncbi:mannitol dehydrogenase family protein [Gluconacetobacter azotocaptans]|uniref:Mannitol dehydrogenase family protein n=1 Tax=Gluconacetobacter azotocaptans TaxID=142834 RepID=A0A7W4JUZ6_9PROT|nr:mannitol dehydrogenase family protein [Gluconacetobacter azotocaptans]MBB2191349.1 mannitol dehydrogenase family protein [Gluconacetobacter azotocaptans]MBM9402494.1 mannitol dehydrogenase family protein [Gluconacetobacter azotocaptans]GBQ30346.1 NADPH-dependent L-sorbose reductase [Gluconacetobacter azotocaptans DSM 13594]